MQGACGRLSLHDEARATRAMMAADRRDRRSPSRAAAGWMRRRSPRNWWRIAARQTTRTGWLAAQDTGELRPEYFPEGSSIPRATRRTGDQCISARADLTSRLRWTGSADMPRRSRRRKPSSLSASCRRYAGREHGRGAGSLLDDPADAGVEPLDRADRLGRRGGQPREDAAVDRHQLAGRLGCDRRQTLGARQISGELRQLRPIGSRDRCRR